MLYSVMQESFIERVRAVLSRLDRNIAAMEMGKANYNKNKKKRKVVDLTLKYSDLIEIEARTKSKFKRSNTKLV